MTHPSEILPPQTECLPFLQISIGFPKGRDRVAQSPEGPLMEASSNFWMDFLDCNIISKLILTQSTPEEETCITFRIIANRAAELCILQPYDDDTPILVTGGQTIFPQEACMWNGQHQGPVHRRQQADHSTGTVIAPETYNETKGPHRLKKQRSTGINTLKSLTRTPTLIIP